MLAFGLVSIAGAAAREALLEPGSGDGARSPPLPHRYDCRRSRGPAVVWFGNGWWGAEAANYQRLVYKPLRLTPTLESSRLVLKLTDPGWLNRSTENLCRTMAT